MPNSNYKQTGKNKAACDVELLLNSSRRAAAHRFCRIFLPVHLSNLQLTGKTTAPAAICSVHKQIVDHLDHNPDQQNCNDRARAANSAEGQCTIAGFTLGIIAGKR